MSDIERALKALAETDARIEPPAELERRIVSEYRHRLKPVPPGLVTWHRLQPVAAVMLAAAAILIAIFIARRPHPAPVITHAPAIEAPVHAEPAPVPIPAKSRPARVPRPREIATEFFPLMDAPPPVDRGELLRVTVPAATMRRVGLPVAEDRLADPVQAEVLVSEEGFATAIRFVKFE